MEKKELEKLVEDLRTELNAAKEIIHNDKMSFSSMSREKEIMVKMIEERDKIISTKNAEILFLKDKEDSYRQQLQEPNKENIKK